MKRLYAIILVITVTFSLGTFHDVSANNELNEEDNLFNKFEESELIDGKTKKSSVYDFMFLGLSKLEWERIEYIVRTNEEMNNPLTSTVRKEEIIRYAFEQVLLERESVNIDSSENNTSESIAGFNIMEIGLCLNLYMFNKCLIANNMANDAIDKTIELYGDSGSDDDSDAFRHSYWNALMTYHLDAGTATLIANAHEFNAPEPAKSMDLFNNDKGRVKGQLWMDYYEPYVIGNKDDDLAEFISFMVKIGVTRKLDSNGDLIPTTEGVNYTFPSSC